MKVISKQEVYKAKYFRITKVELEKNGKKFTKEFIERNSTVFILPIAADGTLHMISQHRDAFNKTLLEVVAGTMEEGADPLETAKRELSEETGLTAKNWKQIAQWELSVNMNSPMYVFVATDLKEGEAHLDEDEEITNVTLSLDEAIKKVVSGEIIASSHVACLLLYRMLREEGML
ncbi:MAG: NUDIX domain-containing protein [Candidatus Levyibacteriota bacterium]